MKSKLPVIVFTVAVLNTLAAITLTFVYQRLVGMVVYDYNLQTFHETLTPEQREGIIRSVRTITDFYTMLLIVTNTLWIAVGWFLLSLFRKYHYCPVKVLTTTILAL